MKKRDLNKLIFAIIIVLVLIFVVLFLTGTLNKITGKAIQENTVTIYSSKSGYISQQYPTKSFSNLASSKQGLGYYGRDGKFRTSSAVHYEYFDLSSIPSNALITSAKLYKYHDTANIGTDTNNLMNPTSLKTTNRVTLGKLTENFLETDSYSTLKRYRNQVILNKVDKSVKNSTITDLVLEYDVKDVVQYWVYGKPNYGFAFLGNYNSAGYGAANYYFRNAFSIFYNYKPKLVVTYSYEENKETIFIGIDKSSYDSLVTETNRFVQDIKYDTGNKVKLEIYTTETPEQIRNDIKEVYENSELKGVILIGNIPYKMTIGAPDGSYPSDAFYRDFYNKCNYDSNGNIIFDSLWNTCFFGTPLNHNKFWIGRIKPPVMSTQGISMLKKYLDRNHAFRTGNKNYEDNMLAYLEILEDPLTTQENYIENFLGSVDESGIFTRNQVTLLTPTQNQGYNDCSMDTLYLNEMKNKNYKYVFLNAHGAPTFHMCNVNSNSLINNPPRAMFYEFRSCNLGMFSEENYLAGWYVFSGEGLIANAAQTIVYGSGIIDAIFTNFLARGLSFGESYKLSNSGLFSQIGDPTLKFQRTINSNSQIKLNTSNINYGTINHCTSTNLEDCDKGETSFEIQNIGSEDLIMPPVHLFIQYDYSREVPIYPQRYSGLDVEFGYNQDIINPGEKRIVYTSFIPPNIGNYSGIFIIISNSKENPVLEIPFTAQGI